MATMSPFQLSKGCSLSRFVAGRGMRRRLCFLPNNALKRAEYCSGGLLSNILELYVVQFAPSTLLQIIVLERR